MKINIDPKAKALIFDLDGTLSDSLPCSYRNLAYHMRRNGLHI